MDKIDLSKLYNGCLCLLTFLYQKAPTLISSIDETRWAPFLLLKELYLAELKEREEGNSITNWNEVKLSFVIQLMSIQSTNFKMNEMFFIIEIMYIMLENIIAQKQSQLYNIICFKYVYPLLQSVELHFINILYNRKFVNLLRDIISKSPNVLFNLYIEILEEILLIK